MAHESVEHPQKLAPLVLREHRERLRLELRALLGAHLCLDLTFRGEGDVELALVAFRAPAGDESLRLELGKHL